MQIEKKIIATFIIGFSIFNTGYLIGGLSKPENVSAKFLKTSAASVGTVLGAAVTTAATDELITTATDGDLIKTATDSVKTDLSTTGKTATDSVKTGLSTASKTVNETGSLIPKTTKVDMEILRTELPDPMDPYKKILPTISELISGAAGLLGVPEIPTPDIKSIWDEQIEEATKDVELPSADDVLAGAPADTATAPPADGGAGAPPGGGGPPPGGAALAASTISI